jgi:hypothetical protein
MRIKSKVISVPATATATQIENALDTHLNNGWKLVGIYIIGANIYAILTRTIAN